MTQKTNGAPAAVTACAPQKYNLNPRVQDPPPAIQVPRLKAGAGEKPIPFLESYYTVPQVASALQVSTTTVRKAFRGRPGVLDVADRRPGRHWYSSMRIPESAIRAYVAERSIQ